VSVHLHHPHVATVCCLCSNEIDAAVICPATRLLTVGAAIGALRLIWITSPKRGSMPAGIRRCHAALPTSTMRFANATTAQAYSHGNGAKLTPVHLGALPVGAPYWAACGVDEDGFQMGHPTTASYRAAANTWGPMSASSPYAARVPGRRGSNSRPGTHPSRCDTCRTPPYPRGKTSNG
jgi:hypothetical protein